MTSPSSSYKSGRSKELDIGRQIKASLDKGSIRSAAANKERGENVRALFCFSFLLGLSHKIHEYI